MSPLLPVPASGSTRIRDLLAAAPDGPVEVVHAGPLAVYLEVRLDVGTELVGVLAAGAAQVPLGLRTRLVGLPSVRVAHVADGVLHLSGTAFRVVRAVDVGVPRLGPAARGAHPLDAKAVQDLVGRGEGLTPYGDDVLCGWLAAHRAHGVPTPAVDRAVRAALPATTRLSAALLGCALRGEALPELAAWLSAPAGRRQAAAAALRAVGATSGTGLLAGATLALDHLSPTEDCAA